MTIVDVEIILLGGEKGETGTAFNWVELTRLQYNALTDEERSDPLINYAING